MSRPIILALALGVLLLTATPAAPSPVSASPQTSAVPASQSRLAELTRSYFVTLNRALATGQFSGLGAIFTARATLTARSFLTRTGPAQTSRFRGLAGIKRYYRTYLAAFPGTHWEVDLLQPLSPTTIVAHALAVGTRASPVLYSVQRITMRNAKIIHLALALYFVK
jgi:hypothetical protein